MDRFECPFDTRNCMLKRFGEWLGLLPESIRVTEKRKIIKRKDFRTSDAEVQTQASVQQATVNGG